MGDAARFRGRLDNAARVFAVEALACNHDSLERVGLGRVPVRVGGVGVYYRRFFDDSDLFRRISFEHTFQALTESVKPSKAHRTGIYLTPVSQCGDALSFHLLRCSTNLAGPTENFCATDWRIVNALNEEASAIFCDHAPLNHVLAQLYPSTPATADQNRPRRRSPRTPRPASYTPRSRTRSARAICCRQRRNTLRNSGLGFFPKEPG